MTYNIKNKKAAIREIKKYLYLVSENLYTSIPRTTIDGIYDDETKAAVKEFQKIRGIEESGNVDYTTFTALYQDYNYLIEDEINKDYILESSGFPLLPGDISEDVRVLNILINELSKTFVNIPKVTGENFYSKETSNAIIALRELFLMEIKDVLDKELYLRMKKELNARRLADQKSKYTD